MTEPRTSWIANALVLTVVAVGIAIGWQVHNILGALIGLLGGTAVGLTVMAVFGAPAARILWPGQTCPPETASRQRCDRPR